MSQGERAATRDANTLGMRTARARQSQGERAATHDANTLGMRTTARARQSQGERAATRDAHTLGMRTARARQSQGERAATRDAHTLGMRTARARQQASTPEWSRLPVLNRPSPAAIHLGHEHQCSHCNARLLSEENESFNSAVQLYYCHALMIIYNLTVKCVLPFRCMSHEQGKRASLYSLTFLSLVKSVKLSNLTVNEYTCNWLGGFSV